MSDEPEMSADEVASLVSLDKARASLLQHRRQYLILAKLQEREARTQRSFAELEGPVPTVKSHIYRRKQCDLEAKAKHSHNCVRAIDALLMRFTVLESQVTGSRKL